MVSLYELKKYPGIGDATIRKLEAAGYTVERLAASTPAEVARVAGIPAGYAEKAVEAARELVGLRFMTARELKKMLASMPRVTTGSRKLDTLLGGGIEPIFVYEFFGEYGSGKTQLCHQLAVNVQLPAGKGGLATGDKPAKAVYIDTEGTFSPKRIEEMAARWAGLLDPDKVLDNIIVAYAVSSEHQMRLVDKLFTMIPRENIKLVIVDSVTSHFRAEYPGRENLVARQQALKKHLHQLTNIATLHKIPVIVTNQVMARPDAFYGDPTQPVGGHVLYHAMGVRVYLKKIGGNRRLARIVDAPHLPQGEAAFAITREGIVDAEEKRR